MKRVVFSVERITNPKAEGNVEGIERRTLGGGPENEWGTVCGEAGKAGNGQTSGSYRYSKSRFARRVLAFICHLAQLCISLLVTLISHIIAFQLQRCFSKPSS